MVGSPISPAYSSTFLAHFVKFILYPHLPKSSEFFIKLVIVSVTFHLSEIIEEALGVLPAV